MNQSFSQNTLDQYISEVLEATGVTQLDAENKERMTKAVREQFQKLVVAIVLGNLTADNRTEFTKLVKEENAEGVVNFIAKIATPELDQKIMAGLEQFKKDLMGKFYQEIS